MKSFPYDGLNLDNCEIYDNLYPEQLGEWVRCHQVFTEIPEDRKKICSQEQWSIVKHSKYDMFWQAETCQPSQKFLWVSRHATNQAINRLKSSRLRCSPKLILPANEGRGSQDSDSLKKPKQNHFVVKYRDDQGSFGHPTFLGQYWKYGYGFIPILVALSLWEFIWISIYRCL